MRQPNSAQLSAPSSARSDGQNDLPDNRPCGYARQKCRAYPHQKQITGLSSLLPRLSKKQARADRHQRRERAALKNIPDKPADRDSLGLSACRISNLAVQHRLGDDEKPAGAKDPQCLFSISGSLFGIAVDEDDAKRREKTMDCYRRRAGL